MREKIKKISCILLIGMLCIFPITTPAAQDLYYKDYAENQNYTTGQVSIGFYVAHALSGMNMKIAFENVKTGQTVFVETDKYKKKSLDTILPVGTYSLDYVSFNDSILFNYKTSLDKKTFSIDQKHVESVNLYVQDNISVPQQMNVTVSITDDPDFSGTVQVTLEGQLDAKYEGTKILKREQVQLVLDGEATKHTQLDAGTFQITKINAYDKTKTAVSIAYPKTVQITRYSNTSYQIKLYLHDTPDNYLVAKSEDMDNYQDFLDKKTVLTYDEYRKGSTFSEENTAASEKTNQDSKAETPKDEAGDPGWDEDPAPVDKKKTFIFVPILIAAGSGCFALFLLIRKF